MYDRRRQNPIPGVDQYDVDNIDIPGVDPLEVNNIDIPGVDVDIQESQINEIVYPDIPPTDPAPIEPAPVHQVATAVEPIQYIQQVDPNLRRSIRFRTHT